MFKRSNSIVNGLDTMPPGEYAVKDIASVLVSGGWISWGTAWTRIKSALEALPDWHWNGRKYPSKSRWIKAEPKSLPLPIEPNPAPALDPTIENPSASSLIRMESMLEAICDSLGITSRPAPQDITKELQCRAALASLLPEVERLIKTKTHYIRKQKLASWRSAIKSGLIGA